MTKFLCESLCDFEFIFLNNFISVFLFLCDIKLIVFYFLGPEFQSSFTGRRGKRLRSKLEALKAKVKVQAKEIYEAYFKTAQATPRSTVAKLANIVAQIERTCDRQFRGNEMNIGNDWKANLESTLNELSLLLKDERAVSAYELHSSGLVQALLKLLANPMKRKFSWSSCNSMSQCDKLLNERLEIFKSIIGNESTATSLVKKLVAVLESIEKLPVYIYDSPGSGYGLQVII